jgi:Putative Ig domain
MRIQRIGLWLAVTALVSGCGGSGGGSGGGGSNPPPAAPAISYGPSGSAMTQFTFAAKAPVSLTPKNSGGAAASWAVTPVLPGGLSFDASTGAITGTPSSFGPTNMTVTATNPGGSSRVALTLRADSVLLNLGASCLADLSGAFQQGVLAISSSNVLTLDCGYGQQHWVCNPYVNAVPASITLSSSGVLLGQVLSVNGSSYARQVTSSSGGPVLWSDSGSSLPVVLSLDDTLIAASDGTNSNIYLNDSLSTAIAAVAIGWLQNDNLAANVSGGAAIFDSGGVKQSGPLLPTLYGPIQVLSATSIYDEGENAIYSLSTGGQTWTPPANAEHTGTAAGPLVVFTTASNQLVAEPH